MDDEDGKERQDRVEANLVEALESVNGVDEACRTDISSKTQQLRLNKFSKTEKGVGAKRGFKSIKIRRLGKRGSL